MNDNNENEPRPADPTAPSGATERVSEPSVAPPPAVTPTGTTPLGTAAADEPCRPRDAAPDKKRPAPGPARNLTRLLAGLVASALFGATAAGAAWVTYQTLETSTANTVAGAPKAVTDDPAGAAISAAAGELLQAVYSVIPTGGTASVSADRVGSAVVYRADGYLVTNFHVVGDSGTVRLQKVDGTVLTGTVVGGDVRSDISVIRVTPDGSGEDDHTASDNAPGLAPGFTLAEARWSDRIPTVGETAIAVGSPFGFTGTVTVGIISAVDRSAGLVNGAALFGMLQTDAAINPGNSGGPLADRSGAIVGINTAIYSSNGQTQGVGFAVPTAIVRQVADRIIADGAFTPGFLGVLAADSFESAGAQVDRVLDGFPAQAADIREGDLIIEVAGAPIRGAGELSAHIGRLGPDTTVVIVVVREGEHRRFTVTLAGAPDETAPVSPEVDGDQPPTRTEPPPDTR